MLIIFIVEIVVSAGHPQYQLLAHVLIHKSKSIALKPKITSLCDAIAMFQLLHIQPVVKLVKIIRIDIER